MWCPQADSNCRPCLRRAKANPVVVPIRSNFRMISMFFGHRGASQNGWVFVKCCHSVATAELNGLALALPERSMRRPQRLGTKQITAAGRRKRRIKLVYRLQLAGGRVAGDYAKYANLPRAHRTTVWRVVSI